MNLERNSIKDLFYNHDGKITDKWSLYLDVYEEILKPFRDKPLRLLEIGVFNGGSLEVWNKYFNNDDKVIVGLDIDKRCKDLKFSTDKIKVIVGNASDSNVLGLIKDLGIDQFDIIIDDGSHTSWDIVKTFNNLFPILKEGGLYIVEDLHCSYWKNFGGGLLDPFSSIEFFKLLIDVVNYEHWKKVRDVNWLLRDFKVTFGLDIDENELKKIHSVSFYNSLCVIKKDMPNKNILGKRVVIGQEAPISDVRHINSSNISDISCNEEILVYKKKKFFDINYLYEIERDKDIMKFKFKNTDIPMWLPLRLPLFDDIIFSYGHFTRESIYKTEVSEEARLEYIEKSILKHPFRDKKANILVFTLGNLLFLDKDKFVNRITDFIYDLYKEDTFILESSMEFPYRFFPSPRFIPEEVLYYSDIINFMSQGNVKNYVFYLNKVASKYNMDKKDVAYLRKIFNKISNSLQSLTITKEEYDNIKGFLDFIHKRLYKLELKEFFNFEKYIKYLFDFSRKIYVEKIIYNYLLDFIEPKLIIMINAYDFQKIALIDSAKKKGIKIAEFQHGFINPLHTEYNFSEEILDEVKSFAPDYMLFWGDFWKENLKMPSEKVVIGFPYFDKKLKDYIGLNKSPKSKKRIMLCSSLLMPGSYIELAKILINKLGRENYEYVFRPHYSEVGRIDNYYKKIEELGYKIDKVDFESLHNSLIETDILISMDYSTVLFEASVFCEKTALLVSKSSSLYLEDRDCPFFVAENIDELIAFIVNGKSNNIMNTGFKEKLFSSNWESNFKNWIESLI